VKRTEERKPASASGDKVTGEAHIKSTGQYRLRKPGSTDLHFAA
jgi:hypothetical protein